MANELEIFAKRLKSARVMAKLSMEGLSQAMDGLVSKQTISKYENAKMLPSSLILIALAKALSVDLDYFFRPYFFDMSDIEVSFRSKRSVNAKDEASLKEKIHDSIERYLAIEEILGIKNSFSAKVSEAPIQNIQDMWMRAQKLRIEWKLGDAPITNVQSLLESHNIRVILLNDVPDGFDGLSGFINDKYPVIVANMNKIAERQRLTMLHELAHLLYNQYFSDDLSEHDKENLCNAFACEMLIPQSLIETTFKRNRKGVSLTELCPLQHNYGVSIDAIILKAHQMDLMSESRYRGYFIRKNQSDSFRRYAEDSRFNEKPTDRFEALVYGAIAQDLITESKAASLLDISLDEVRNKLNIV
jgi:Zn-dependent peptidase ImmA (M78 family)/DNA-binding XRE family transcriptional regulator